jgi:hypothetical protein
MMNWETIDTLVKWAFRIGFLLLPFSLVLLVVIHLVQLRRDMNELT